MTESEIIEQAIQKLPNISEYKLDTCFVPILKSLDLMVFNDLAPSPNQKPFYTVEFRKEKVAPDYPLSNYHWKFISID